MFKISKLKYTLLLSTFYFLLSVTIVNGARIYFEPQETVVGTEGTFLVAVLLDSEADTINAISVSIDVSEEFTIKDTRDGDSIISLWVEKPSWNVNTRELKFSGLIPGGFFGTYAHLLTLELSTTGKVGEGTLSFNPEETIILRNSANAEKIAFDLQSITLPVILGKENIPVEIIDTDPPERFVPFIAQYKQTFEGNYVVVFSTQDKISGICCYFVAEAEKETSDYSSLAWKEAESPYTLNDQSLRSFIYIKAVDKEGNETIAIVSPQSTGLVYRMLVIASILIVMAVVLVSAVFYARKRPHGQNISQYNSIRGNDS